MQYKRVAAGLIVGDVDTTLKTAMWGLWGTMTWSMGRQA